MFPKEIHFLYCANLKKDTGVSLQIFFKWAFSYGYQICFLFGNDESVVNRLLLLLYKKFIIYNKSNTYFKLKTAKTTIYIK